MEMARQVGGSVLATAGASARRPRGPVRRLSAAARRPDDPANPYLRMLAWADAFVITGDSESMLAEASGRKPSRAPGARRSRARAPARMGVASRRRRAASPRAPRPQRGLERILADRARARAAERDLTPATIWSRRRRIVRSDSARETGFAAQRYASTR
jgi:hypothetical protein